MAKLLHDIPAILDYIKTYGKIDGCSSVTIVHKCTIARALDQTSKYYNAEFAAQVQDAFAYYRKTNRHPSEDPEIKQDVLAQFKAGVKAGQSNLQEIFYDEQGRVKSKQYKKSGLERWVYETVFPPRVMTEQAILFVTSNQLQDLADSALAEPIKTEIMRWLSDWIKRASEDLRKSGLSLKYLEKGD